MPPITFVLSFVLVFLTSVFAYLLGCARRLRYEAPVLMGRKDLRQAEKTADDLLGTIRRLQGQLADHEGVATRFKRRVARLKSADNTIELNELANEAAQLLDPTNTMAARLVEAYDKFRLHGNILRSYQDLRHDPLTGLYSRRSLDETLRLAFQLMLRNKDRQLAVLVADLDQFGEINRRFGNRYGDRTLKAVGQILRQCVRETDVIARSGGNEFAVVLPECDSSYAAVIAERVRANVAVEFPFSISLGIATSTPGDTPVTLLARADSALSAAKAEGGDRVFLHNGDGIELIETVVETAAAHSPEQADELLEEMIQVSDERSLTDVLIEQ